MAINNQLLGFASNESTIAVKSLPENKFAKYRGSAHSYSTSGQMSAHNNPLSGLPSPTHYLFANKICFYQ